MKNRFLAALLLGMILVLAGCGGDDNPPPPSTFFTQIFSDPAIDGDIARSVGGTLTITQGNTQSVLVGTDPVDGAELRAFLDFPLTGVGGVPGNAIIVSATLNLFMNSILAIPPGGTLPIRIDLVSFQPPTLIGDDFSRTLLPALATTIISPPISNADFGANVPIDVTALMQEAQRLGVLNFQVRLLREVGSTAPGLIEINDTTGVNRIDLAPLLEVTYF